MTARLPSAAEVATMADELLAVRREHNIPDPKPRATVEARASELEGHGLSPESARILAGQEQEAGTLDRPGVPWRQVDEWRRPMVWGEPDAPTLGRHGVSLGPPEVAPGGLPLAPMRWADRVPMTPGKRGER